MRSSFLLLLLVGLLAPDARAEDGCSAEQLRGLATSTFFVRAEDLCGRFRGLHRAGRFGEDEAAGSRWNAFGSFCAGSSGLTSVCSLTDRGRDLLLEGWGEAIEDVSRRTQVGQDLCTSLDVAESTAAFVPAERTNELSSSIGSVRAFCESHSGGAPPQEALAVVQTALRIAQDLGSRGQTSPRATAEAWDRVASSVWTRLDATGSAESVREGDIGSADGAALGSAGPAAGVLDLALHGLASLLVSRARAELEASAVDRLEAIMCAPGARSWFGTTCAFLAGRSPELGVRLGTGLRTAFARDILELPRRALQNADEAGGPSALRYRLFFETVDALLESTDPREIADRVITLGAGWACGGQRGHGRRCREARRTVTRAGLVLLALASQERLDSLSEPAVLGIVETMSGGTLDHQGRHVVRRLLAQLRALERASSATAPAGDEDDARLAQVLPIARSTVNVLNLALRSAADSRSRLAGPPLDLPPGIPEVLDAMARRQLTDVMVSTTAAMSALDRPDALPAPVVRALAVGAELADAETQEQAEAAVAAVAAPPGAWRMKRSRFVLSLGGLVGLHAGAEWLTGPALPDPPSTGAASVLGAVGLDVSFPLDPSTVGVFVSVLDLGALLSLPLGEVSEATVSSDGEVRKARVDVTNPVDIAQVLSPGLYLRWGLPGLPLVLGAGASVVPSGRHVQELRDGSGVEDPVSEDVNVIRLTALLALDVTLFAL